MHKKLQAPPVRNSKQRPGVIDRALISLTGAPGPGGAKPATQLNCAAVRCYLYAQCAPPPATDVVVLTQTPDRFYRCGLFRRSLYKSGPLMAERLLAAPKTLGYLPHAQ